MRTDLLWVLIASVMLPTGWALAAEPSAETREADGRTLYLTFQCWQCHGYEGQGGAAPRLAAKDYTYEAFARFVRHPNVMPAYPVELLGDADLRRIFDFVLAIPDPPPLEDTPLLDGESGSAR